MIYSGSNQDDDDKKHRKQGQKRHEAADESERVRHQQLMKTVFKIFSHLTL